MRGDGLRRLAQRSAGGNPPSAALLLPLRLRFSSPRSPPSGAVGLPAGVPRLATGGAAAKKRPRVARGLEEGGLERRLSFRLLHPHIRRRQPKCLGPLRRGGADRGRARRRATQPEWEEGGAGLRDPPSPELWARPPKF